MYGHKYTDEERKFLMEYIPGHSYKEIAAAFTKTFGWEMSVGKVKSFMGNNRLNNGLTGRFEKGHVPANKGAKGICAAGCEKTWFKKGNIPKNHRPVGSERISKDGYIEIKVAEPNKWKLKHRVVWESIHGKIPRGYIVVFRDNDKSNVDIRNLILVKRSTQAVLNHTGLCKHSGEFKETAIAISELKIAGNKAKKKSKNN